MRRLPRCWSVRLLVVPLWLLSAGAHADLIDPAEEACSKVGEACTIDDQSGACVAQTCSRLDYSNMGPDGTPGTEDYECVRCEIGAKVAAPEPEPTPTPAPTDEKTEEKKPAGQPAAEPVTTAKGTRCAVGPSTSAMSLVLGLGLLGLAIRRRA